MADDAHTMPATGAARPEPDGSGLRIEPPSLSLPTGGGAVRGIDESFTTNPSNGTVSVALPLPLSPARNGYLPPVRVRYESGAGNGVLGLGWSLDLPSVRRRTDQRLPRYRGEDAFLLGGGEELVPALRLGPAGWEADTTQVGPLTVSRYKPRIEGEFARIEQVAHPTQGSWWRVTTRDNVTTFYGTGNPTRIADPADPRHVFQWLPAISFDDRGNCLVYEYKPEDLAGVPEMRSEANRHNGIASFVNRHLKRLRYGNRTPVFADPADPYVPPPPPDAWLFHVVFDYGDHDPDRPGLMETAGLDWPGRADPFSGFRSGFEIRTYRLLRRVLMFHQFDELAGGAPCLVRSLDMEYVSSGAGTQLASDVTYLRAATQSGYAAAADGSYSKRSLPPLQFEYEALRWSTEVRTADAGPSAMLPEGAAGGYAWVDLFGEGIAGLFTEQADAWFYKGNLGDVEQPGRLQLDAARLVAPRPSFAAKPGGVLRFRDLYADGRTQLVLQGDGVQGYFDRGDGAEWLPFRPFDTVVHIDLDDRNLRTLDLDGDGRADLLVSEDNAFVNYRAAGAGYRPAERTPKPFDEERGPAIVFAEEQQTIYLADMTGDGLQDIVRIRNRDVCYWPNLGYGRFGAKVAMDRPPVFAPPDQFDAKYLHLADISGTGTTDVLYCSPQGCSAYLNFAGNGWSAAQPIQPFFPAEAPNRIEVVDLLGHGTACLVWSSPLPEHAAAPLRYMDLMGGRKPHLLTRYLNNLGKEVGFSYQSSTWFYLSDKRDGRPWATKLPFPVHCLRQVEVLDRIAGARLVTNWRYHHGYYDRVEREFRGFGMVEQQDAETFEDWARDQPGHLADRSLHQVPVLTRTWFHTGAVTDRNSILTRFRDEYWDREMARQGFPATVDEPELPDARLLPGPGVDPAALAPAPPDLWREALRACKGMALRTESFGLDAPDNPTAAQRLLQLSPYSVATHNCVIELLQPMQGGQHAVFVVKESEGLTLHYERDLAAPRLGHTLNVALDQYGNVLESATVAYGRAAPPDLPAAVRAIQAQPRLTYTHTELTADVLDAAAYRLRLPSRVTSYEITGLPRVGPLYGIADFMAPGFHVLTDTAELAFDHQAGAAGPPARRRLRCKETLFLDATLAAALPLHGMQALALPFESYELAFPAALAASAFGGRVTDQMLTEGRYVQLDGADWWVPSGRWDYLGDGTAADAARRFFVPVGHQDTLGARTAISYLGSYALLQDAVEDAAQNRTAIEAFDLRALKPTRLRDPNGNLSELLLDEMGWVKATALRGKGAEADDLDGLATISTDADALAAAAFAAGTDSVALDASARTLLQNASARYIYDPGRYFASGGAAPPMCATILREQHAAVQADGPLQISFEYSNGMGKVELRKVPAEPGLAKRVTLGAVDAYTVDTVDTAGMAPPRLRWLGTGRRVLNNKGNPVLEYEPFFSASPGFETARELVESGVTRRFSYDPLDRVVRVDEPDGTFARTVFDAWSVASYDRNDTVLDSPWYSRRILRQIDAELAAAGKDPVREAEAAGQAAAHANTPAIRHFDPVGRPVTDVEDDGAGPGGVSLLYATLRVLDATGDLLRAEDPRGNTAVTYAYDMRGRIVAHRTMDGGGRWMLDDAMGQPRRSWDERGHAFSFSYDDPLHRITGKRVVSGDGPVPLDCTFERLVYGEGQDGDVSRNLRGRVARLYDTAGRVETLGFDFKGNLTGSTRRFAIDPTAVPDWSGPQPDALLLPETFSSAAAYDALDRVTRRVTADGSVTVHRYNAANMLDQVAVTQGATTETCVTGIDYDEKGQRERIGYGNGVATEYRYDAETFRLTRLTSRRADGTTLQDLHYTYDPAGNATHVEDDAVPTVWFDNQLVTGLATYRYTPTYRLAEASGREHVAQVGAGPADNWDDAGFVAAAGAGDPMPWRNYTQSYDYDPAGNIATMRHVAAGGSWTRAYSYAMGSNRLLQTAVGDNAYAYAYHPAHGFMTGMPHLSVMRWTMRDELQAVATQVVNDGTPETTWYVYDGRGKRVRKVTRRAAPAGAAPPPKSERFVLDGVEIYREYGGDAALSLERSELEVQDDRQRVALIETEGAARLVRYQGADHLQSARVETDETGRVISYEEYHPFGTTAYQAADSGVRAAAKRYRYTGMERDGESGLEYHGARHYIPWLGRWTRPDGHAATFDGNRYAYVRNNPVKFRDPNGMFEEPTHGILTYRLGIAAGIPPGDAARIALATAAMDHDASTSPAGVGDIARFRLIPQTVEYHYPRDTFAGALGAVNQDIADQQKGIRRPDDLERFGRHLHTLEDIGFADTPGPHMRHDPGRPVQRNLSPALGFLGTALAGGMLVAGARLLQSSWSTGAKAVVGALIGLALGFGIYLIVLGLATHDIGHPDYMTEIGNHSTSFSHAADEAPQDPKANTAEMLKIYEKLQQYARARYGNVQMDPDGALQAIQQDVAADNSCLISNFANSRPIGPDGAPLASYSEILSTRTPDRGRSWKPEQIDATNPSGEEWRYAPGVRACPR